MKLPLSKNLPFLFYSSTFNTLREYRMRLSANCYKLNFLVTAYWC